MILHTIINKTARFVSRNLPTLLVLGGGAGLVTTAVLTARATKKVMEDTCYVMEFEDLKKEEVILSNVKHYALPVITGVVSFGLLYSGNKRFLAIESGLIAAYSTLQQQYNEYRAKVIEIMGEGRAKDIEDAIIMDKFESYFNPENNPGNILVYDTITNQYLETTMLELSDAQYHLNRLLSMNDCCSVNQWCELTGQNYISEGNCIGWSAEEFYDQGEYCWIEFEMECKEADGSYRYILKYTKPSILIARNTNGIMDSIRKEMIL